MAEILDNDLLTLWINAGSLTRDEVRALIDELQSERLGREIDARNNESAITEAVQECENSYKTVIADWETRVRALEDEIVRLKNAR
jgi:polyhydroxyalkanoate synthesis regulator phasin